MSDEECKNSNRMDAFVFSMGVLFLYVLLLRNNVWCVLGYNDGRCFWDLFINFRTMKDTTEKYIEELNHMVSGCSLIVDKKIKYLKVIFNLGENQSINYYNMDNVRFYKSQWKLMNLDEDIEDQKQYYQEKGLLDL